MLIDQPESIETLRSLLFSRDDREHLTEKSYIDANHNRRTALTAILNDDTSDNATLTVTVAHDDDMITIVYVHSSTSDPFVATTDDVLDAVAVLDSIGTP